jgi:hypothetical protein
MTSPLKPWRIAAVAALGLALAACASVARIDAGGDVHAFLVSIRNGDKQAFDAHVDRPALKEQLHARLMTAAKRQNGDFAALGALLIGPLVDVGVDTLVQPDVFRAVAENLGYSADAPIPDRLMISSALKPLDADHVCIPRRKEGACLLVFRNEGGVWRLIDFEGDLSMLRRPQR